ncbi:MAG: helix-turn-helix domain-containing protein [Proteobacteria bacterium]|nr:helix-turn-helix domain-containing protein [Pseudomonadota bacterium]
MSISVTSLVRPIGRGVLRPGEKQVLMTLAQFAADDGGRVFPSNARVAHECCISVRSVQSHLRGLEKLGILVCVANAGGGRGSRRCRLDLARLKALHPGQADGTGPSGERGSRVTPFPRPRGATASPQGCNSFMPGVQKPHARGATFSPDKSVERSIERSGEGAPAQVQKESKDKQSKCRVRKLEDVRVTTVSEAWDRVPNLEELVITPQMEAWGREHAPGLNLYDQLDRFKANRRANNRTCHNYAEDLRGWLLREIEFSKSARRGGAAVSGPVGADQWRRRVERYWNGGLCDGPWLDAWGFRPGEKLCAAPPEVLWDVMGSHAPEARPARATPKVVPNRGGDGGMSARGTSVPPPLRTFDDLVETDELRQWARANAPGAHLGYELAAFREYCFQEAKQYKDFGQAFRSRLLIGREDGGAEAEALGTGPSVELTLDEDEVTEDLLKWAQANVPGADLVKELKDFRWYCATLSKDYRDFCQAFRSFLQATAV